MSICVCAGVCLCVSASVMFFLHTSFMSFCIENKKICNKTIECDTIEQIV
jgi:hypothetical protein